MDNNYDVAAYVWPSYCNDPRSRIFWPGGLGEWESIHSNVPKYQGHLQPRRPAWGYVNEADPCVMEMQIGAAADHGVNVFIYDWYWYDRRPFLEGCLNDGYLKARNNDRVKFYLMWANHDADTVWDKRISHENLDPVWLGSVDRSEFERICDRLISRYFPHPSYYRISGKPLFTIYDIGNLIKGLGGVKAAARALDRFRERAVQAGLGGLHLQCILQGNIGANVTGIRGDGAESRHEAVKALGFDSVTHYQYVHLTDVDRDYLEILKDVQLEYIRTSSLYEIPYFPHVSVGWDNNPRYTGFHPRVTTNNGPENFEKALRIAREHADMHLHGLPRLITVNSWNEWTESSYLQPCSLYGYGYLDAVKNVFAGAETGKITDEVKEESSSQELTA